MRLLVNDVRRHVNPSNDNNTVYSTSLQKTELSSDKSALTIQTIIYTDQLIKSCVFVYNNLFNFLSKDQLTKKKDRILIKDLISNK